MHNKYGDDLLAIALILLSCQLGKRLSLNIMTFHKVKQKNELQDYIFAWLCIPLLFFYVNTSLCEHIQSAINKNMFLDLLVNDYFLAHPRVKNYNKKTLSGKRFKRERHLACSLINLNFVRLFKTFFLSWNKICPTRINLFKTNN